MSQGLLMPMAWAIQRFLVLPYDRLIIHRDVIHLENTVPMAGDSPVVDNAANDSIAQINQQVIDEPLITPPSAAAAANDVPWTMPWLTSAKISGAKVHCDVPESPDSTMTNTNLLLIVNPVPTRLQ